MSVCPSVTSLVCLSVCRSVGRPARPAGARVSIDAKLGWDHEGRSRLCRCCRRQGRFRCISVSVRDTAVRTTYCVRSSASRSSSLPSGFFSAVFQRGWFSKFKGLHLSVMASLLRHAGRTQTMNHERGAPLHLLEKIRTHFRVRISEEKHDLGARS